jgi:hypothetical protein
MDKTETPQKQEDLLKAIESVLSEAVALYEDEVKKGEGIDAAQTVDDMKGQAKGIIGEGTGAAMAKEEDKDKDDDKKKDKKEDMEKTDSELMDTYKSVVAQLEARGLIKKDEPAAKKEMKKSEEPAAAEAAVATTAQPEVSDLKKSVDERFESLEKAVKSVAETVKKIAAAPRERKGLTGYQPLKKSEETPALKKGEVLNKLLELKKSGNPAIDTGLINRVETGRLVKSDIERIKSLGILAE